MKTLLIILLITAISICIYISTMSVKEGINVNKTAAQTFTEAVITEEEKNTPTEHPFYTNKPSNNTSENYNVNKYDIQYHDSPEEIEKDEGYGLGLQTAWVFDPKEQKAVLMQVPKMKTFPTYEIPGYYKYGYNTYVPNYTDSILLSSSKS